MKPIRKRLVEQLTSKGMPVGKANATATKVLKRAGDLGPEGQETAKGKVRTAMGAAGRAKDRAAKGTHPPADLKYNPRTNRATLKD